MVKRNTVQRAIVLDTVRKLQCHATADEVYAEIIKTCPSISRATVYRNLQQLCELGEIKKREIPSSPDRYDHILSDHYHARCTLCGKVLDVDMDYQQELLTQVKNSHGFALTGHDIIFRGICPDCQAKESKAQG